MRVFVHSLAMHKSCYMAATSQVPSRCRRGSLLPTSHSAIGHIYTELACVQVNVLRLLPFFLPFIIDNLLLKLFPCIIHNASSMKNLDFGLHLIMFFAATYVVFLGKRSLLQFKLDKLITLHYSPTVLPTSF